jgi:hypothetical protein
VFGVKQPRVRGGILPLGLFPSGGPRGRAMR